MWMDLTNRGRLGNIWAVYMKQYSSFGSLRFLIFCGLNFHNKINEKNAQNTRKNPDLARTIA